MFHPLRSAHSRKPKRCVLRMVQLRRNLLDAQCCTATVAVHGAEARCQVGGERAQEEQSSVPLISPDQEDLIRALLSQRIRSRLMESTKARRAAKLEGKDRQ